MSTRPPATLAPSDPFARLRESTRARIGLGRSGDSLPTKALLEFQAAASQARDAVRTPLDRAALRQRLAPRLCLEVHSQAGDRDEYLRRPDLGRALGQGEDALERHRGAYDLLFVLADGLSAGAVMTHAVPLLEAVEPRLEGWAIAPLVLAAQARVALGDALAHRLGAAMVAVLIGERPGLSVADSLGVYLTWAPREGHPDALRNCISNIHGDGLSYPRAADLLAWLARAARARQLTGTALKPDLSPLPGADPDERHDSLEAKP